MHEAADTLGTRTDLLVTSKTHLNQKAAGRAFLLPSNKSICFVVANAPACF